MGNAKPSAEEVLTDSSLDASVDAASISSVMEEQDESGESPMSLIQGFQFHNLAVPEDTAAFSGGSF